MCWYQRREETFVSIPVFLWQPPKPPTATNDQQWMDCGTFHLGTMADGIVYPNIKRVSFYAAGVAVRGLSNEVIPGLYIGGYAASEDLNHLKENKITHILSLGPFTPVFPDVNPSSRPPLSPRPSLPQQFSYKVINIGDVPTENILQYFNETYEFTDTALKSGGRVLIHCMAGISRSATIVTAYLMRSQSMPVKQALAHLKAVRNVINPNLGFFTQLEIYQDVRYDVDTKHAAYRRFLMANMTDEREMNGYISNMTLASDPEKARQQAFATVTQTLLASSEQKIIRCKKCRRKLVYSDNIVEHQPGKGQTAFSYFKRDGNINIIETTTTSDPITMPNAPLNPLLAQLASQASTCSSYFIEPMEWIPGLDSEEIEGRIDCPKCATKLGSYNWAGAQCSCGRWIIPAFTIHRKQVDESRVTA
ncbi:protein-tyrosine phosphatase-like protein [Jimgerdemannia flammicorona]|uniref:protein-tyrosine-phosphatase n=1 Tax=Jimgerdemannia flammicorona TaxID=994334 RepID=A0A433Q4V1_9FUNG|nr:protein-tyrosine phosphatase-like protein [Jimgerdemannia flammicorona]